ncbi:hypothetical protein WJX72_001625 [[Myrmecia] bisecta]|uniref:DC-UbP/UBTD2 N-terminal domain-containing protein n=1 Tax=[Myrmecia] bisecta TaxID=41462 RepID=A0AAW1QPB7_9CHLO
MGCLCSKQRKARLRRGSSGTRIKVPVWRTQEPGLTEKRLQAMTEEFWDTAPAYGGDKVIWDALKAACEADPSTAALIVDTAGIIVATDDLSLCYDELGRKYELPKYVLSAPTNLFRPKTPKASEQSSAQVELLGRSAGPMVSAST